MVSGRILATMDRNGVIAGVVVDFVLRMKCSMALFSDGVSERRVDLGEVVVRGDAFGVEGERSFERCDGPIEKLSTRRIL